MRGTNYGFLLIALSLLIFSGCKSNHTQTYLPYNTLARSPHLQLIHDGYIIGVEKRYKGEVRDPKTGNPKHGYPDRYLPISEQNTNDQVCEKTYKRDKKFCKVTNDWKAMLVTHITSSFDGKQEFVDNENNAYKEYRRHLKDYELNYNSGYHTLSLFKKDLTDKLNSKPYTHILVFSMGWNNDQYESIYRYNEMVENLRKVAKKNGDSRFRPLVIGFTWPSVWFGISDSWLKKYLIGFLFSYFNKANDADEIGYTIANWVLNNIVLSAKVDYYKKHHKDIKVVAIGHSLGARILSRAIFSKEYIIPDKRENKTSETDLNENKPPEVDLFIGLQGAFSAHRFIEGKGWEGYPYAEFNERKTSFALTSSVNDDANPKVRFVTGARHVGGRYGLNKAIKYDDVFKVIKWTNIRKNKQKELDAIKAQIQSEHKKVIMINASSIVVDKKDDSSKDPEKYPKYRNYPPDAHNDILDEDMAELIWALINGLPSGDLN